MGALTSRQNIGVEEVDIPSNSVYRYPPKSGEFSQNNNVDDDNRSDSGVPGTNGWRFVRVYFTVERFRWGIPCSEPSLVSADWAFNPGRVATWDEGCTMFLLL